MRIAAIVPMREHSVRVPFKNRRVIGGQPLYRWIVRSLLECPRIDEVVIDTDSEPIMEDVRVAFADVRIVVRPEHLRADTLPMNDVLRNTTEQVAADWYVQTHSTNPLLRSHTIARAIEQVLASTSHDSLFSVTRRHVRLWSGRGEPINHDPAVLLRTQDLAPVFEENSCLYMFARETLVQRGNRIGARPMMFDVPKDEAHDIDDEADFQLAELMLRARMESA